MSVAFTIDHTWNGKKSSHLYKLKLSIVHGDLAFFLDAPFFDDPVPKRDESLISLVPQRNLDENRHTQLAQYECISVLIATGSHDVPLESQEYIEVLLGPHGHYLITGYTGQGDEKGDQSMLLEQRPQTLINRKLGRWSSKVSVPFFFLPAPGDDPNDALILKWKFNFCAVHDLPNTVEGREYLSHAKLKGTIPNFHQLQSFVELVLSDASSQRLRSISRASVSSKSVHDNSAIRNLNFDSEFTPNKLKRDLQNGKIEPVSEVLQRYKREYDVSTKQLIQKLMTLKELEALCAQQMQPGEHIVMCGKFWKRDGWFYSRCILILTSLPKLIYVDHTAPFAYRGNLDWKMTRPVSVVQTTDERFNITLADCSKTFHFYDDSEFGVSRWVDVITDVNRSWKAYLVESLGQYDADVLAAMQRQKAAASSGSSCFIL